MCRWHFGSLLDVSDPNCRGNLPSLAKVIVVYDARNLSKQLQADHSLRVTITSKTNVQDYLRCI